MKIKEIMCTPTDPVDPFMPVAAAAQRMRDEDVGCLLVGWRDQLLGIVTDRDIVVRALAIGADMAREKVWNVMSTEVVSCSEDQSAEEVARLMEEHGVRRLPVFDKKGRLTGIVSRSDLHGCGSKKKPYAVTFYKHLTDGCGTLHEVPIRTVYVAAVDGEDEAVTAATATFKKHWGPAKWKGAADGCRVDSGR